MPGLFQQPIACARIDVIAVALCGGAAGDPSNCPPTDQRGDPRPQDGNGDGDPRCDIGAYEARSVPAPTATATPTASFTATTVPNTPTSTVTFTPSPTLTSTETSIPTWTPAPCVGTPLPPELVAPANKTAFHKTAVVVSWNSVACASRYQVQVRQDSKKNPDWKNKSVAGFSLKLKKLAPDHRYLWRVRSCADTTCSAWTPWRSFRINP